MTRLIVPLLATPSQRLTIPLGGQSVDLKVYEKAFGVFVDVVVNDAAIITGVQARNLTRIVRGAYLGFTGDLLFSDTEGALDPAWPGFGTRYLLIYDDDI